MIRLLISGITLLEQLGGFGIGEIEPALARNEKFPANRGLGIKKMNTYAVCRSDFRRTKTRRATTDHCQ